MHDQTADIRLPIVDEIGEALYSAATTVDARPALARVLERLRRRHHATVMVLAAFALVGSAGGLALAGTFSDAAENPQAWVDGQPVAPEPTSATDQTAKLGILRRPRAASDVLSPLQVSQLTNTPTAANGPNQNLSRQVQGLTAGSAWVIPGDGMICFQYTVPGVGGGGTCQPDSAVAENDWPVVTSRSQDTPGAAAVGGLVPDGVPHVVLTLDDATTITAQVHENVYLAVIHGELDSVSYTSPAGGPITLHN